MPASFVVTSKLTIFARRIVEHFGLAGHFTRVYGSQPDGRFDDKAELIAHVLESEKIDASAAVMIGDRAVDIKGARANSVRSVGVLWATAPSGSSSRPARIGYVWRPPHSKPACSRLPTARRARDRYP